MYRTDTMTDSPPDTTMNQLYMKRYDSMLTPSLSAMNPTVPIDSTIIPLEEQINHDVLFHYIRYAFYHYVPNKPNKKKMKQFIEAIPYFLPDTHQNLFFKLLRTYPIETYWDSRDKIQDYGYLLYSSFHESLRKTHKSKEDYQLDLYQNKSKHKQIHNLLYFIILFIFMVILYKWIL
jgi:hypothetical protein